jgi:hypothetical protein
VQKTDFVLYGDIFNYNYYLFIVHGDFNCCEICVLNAGVVVNGVTQATSIISSDEASLSIMHVDDAAAIYLFFSLPQLISRSF